MVQKLRPPQKEGRNHGGGDYRENGCQRETQKQKQREISGSLGLPVQDSMCLLEQERWASVLRAREEDLVSPQEEDGLLSH